MSDVGKKADVDDEASAEWGKEAVFPTSTTDSLCNNVVRNSRPGEINASKYGMNQNTAQNGTTRNVFPTSAETTNNDIQDQCPASKLMKKKDSKIPVGIAVVWKRDDLTSDKNRKEISAENNTRCKSADKKNSPPPVKKVHRKIENLKRCSDSPSRYSPHRHSPSTLVPPPVRSPYMDHPYGPYSGLGIPAWPPASLGGMSKPESLMTSYAGLTPAQQQQLLELQWSHQQQQLYRERTFAHGYMYHGILPDAIGKYEQYLQQTEMQRQAQNLHHHHHHHQLHPLMQPQFLDYDIQRATPIPSPSSFSIPSPSSHISSPVANPQGHSLWPADFFHHNSSTTLSPISLASSTPSPVTVQDSSASLLSPVSYRQSVTAPAVSPYSSSGQKSKCTVSGFSPTSANFPVKDQKSERKSSGRSNNNLKLGADAKAKRASTPTPAPLPGADKKEEEMKLQTFLKAEHLPVRKRHDFSRMESLIEKRDDDSVPLLAWCKGESAHDGGSQETKPSWTCASEAVDPLHSSATTVPDRQGDTCRQSNSVDKMKEESPVNFRDLKTVTSCVDDDAQENNNKCAIKPAYPTIKMEVGGESDKSIHGAQTYSNPKPVTQGNQITDGLCNGSSAPSAGEINSNYSRAGVSDISESGNRDFHLAGNGNFPQHPVLKVERGEDRGMLTPLIRKVKVEIDDSCMYSSYPGESASSAYNVEPKAGQGAGNGDNTRSDAAGLGDLPPNGGGDTTPPIKTEPERRPDLAWVKVERSVDPDADTDHLLEEDEEEEEDVNSGFSPPELKPFVLSNGSYSCDNGGIDRDKVKDKDNADNNNAKDKLTENISQSQMTSILVADEHMNTNEGNKCDKAVKCPTTSGRFSSRSFSTDSGVANKLYTLENPVPPQRRVSGLLELAEAADTAAVLLSSMKSPFETMDAKYKCREQDNSSGNFIRIPPIRTVEQENDRLTLLATVAQEFGSDLLKSPDRIIGSNDILKSDNFSNNPVSSLNHNSLRSETLEPAGSRNQHGSQYSSDQIPPRIHKKVGSPPVASVAPVVLRIPHISGGEKRKSKDHKEHKDHKDHKDHHKEHRHSHHRDSKDSKEKERHSSDEGGKIPVLKLRKKSPSRTKSSEGEYTSEEMQPNDQQDDFEILCDKDDKANKKHSNKKVVVFSNNQVHDKQKVLPLKLKKRRSTTDALASANLCAGGKSHGTEPSSPVKSSCTGEFKMTFCKSGKDAFTSAFTSNSNAYRNRSGCEQEMLSAGNQKSPEILRSDLKIKIFNPSPPGNHVRNTDKHEAAYQNSKSENSQQDFMHSNGHTGSSRLMSPSMASDVTDWEADPALAVKAVETDEEKTSEWVTQTLQNTKFLTYEDLKKETRKARRPSTNRNKLTPRKKQSSTSSTRRHVKPCLKAEPVFRTKNCGDDDEDEDLPSIDGFSSDAKSSSIHLVRRSTPFRRLSIQGRIRRDDACANPAERYQFGRRASISPDVTQSRDDDDDDFGEEMEVKFSGFEELEDEMRILTEIQGLFYTGKLNALQPPDVYGVTLDNERGAPPHFIFSAEEVLEKCIREIKPSRLVHGLRICAYWSPQYSGLYAGKVSCDYDPAHSDENDLIPIEFDDGDTGVIKRKEIRLLSKDHPVGEHDPNPLQTLEKKQRKRRHSSANTSQSGCNGDHEEADCGETYCAKAPKMNEDANSGRCMYQSSRMMYWTWKGMGFRKPKSKKDRNKEFFTGIQRGDEEIQVGDSALFISSGNLRPFIGRVEKFWEKKGKKIVNVRWFYHPEEVQVNSKKLQGLYVGALFESPHIDENDVQTIAKKCNVLTFDEFKKQENNLMKWSKTLSSSHTGERYYVAGFYDPYTYNLQLKDLK